jgi:HAD superfamily hydrolase (TIGR01509 family)
MSANTLLFDLGDTLLHRNRPHVEWDIDLINSVTGIDKQHIQNTINDCLSGFDGIYKFYLDNEKCKTLVAEDAYYMSFFDLVLAKLNASQYLTEFLLKRRNERRYVLYPDTLKYLERLKTKYTLGVVTNGRPSRHRVLDQLELTPYFSFIFVSDEIGYKKPDTTFFTYVQNKLQTSSSAVILFDDEEKNIEAAQAFGWTATLIDHKNEGYKVLDRLL